MENKEFKPIEKNLVSIVLTYFNREDFIMDQLDSLLNQTYKNWELIIMDDCSTDGSEIMFHNWINKNSDKNIAYVKNKKNLGLAKNFEKGLWYTSGEYIAVCDADDVWFKDKLERQIDFLKKNSDYGMVYSDLVVVDEKLKKIKKPFIKSYLFSFSNPKDDSFEELLNENHITAPTILFRAELKDKIIPFSKYGLQDHWIVILSSMLAKIGFIDQPTIYYRQHSGNMVGVSKLSMYSLIFQKNHDFLEKHLQMKRNSSYYLADLNSVKWIKGGYRKMILNKIDKTRILVECLAQFRDKKFKCRAYLAVLWKLKAYREMMQIIYFRFKL
jgi:glycosyltransferase involved in cell wall biosynthesis